MFLEGSFGRVDSGFAAYSVLVSVNSLVMCVCCYFLRNQTGPTTERSLAIQAHTAIAIDACGQYRFFGA